MTVTVEQVRKGLEDMLYADLIEIYMIKHTAFEAGVGDNSVVFIGDPYDSADDYVVDIYDAIDVDGIDVSGELEVLEENKTANGFIINAIRACTIRLQTYRKVPKISFWTGLAEHIPG